MTSIYHRVIFSQQLSTHVSTFRLLIEAESVHRRQRFVSLLKPSGAYMRQYTKHHCFR